MAPAPATQRKVLRVVTVDESVCESVDGEEGTVEGEVIGNEDPGTIVAAEEDDKGEGEAADSDDK